ncbi:MAG: DNA repair protein RecO [Candidatus Levyibacteriota bacterium]|nr:MAG: DNA repair protein RecO [Candidatus Levybacteria bacterium]
MRHLKTEGIIIKRRNSGEADRILTVFTKNSGKILVKAIGVRRIISRRSPHIELLNYSFLTVYKGRNLPILTEAQTIDDFSSLKTNLKTIGIAYHLCELIDSLCAENQEQVLVFSLLLQTLINLSEGKDAKQVVYDFEHRLLLELGFSSHIPLLRTVDTHAAIEGILERRLKTTQLLQHFL